MQPTSNESFIQISGLVKEYGRVVAVNGIDLTIAKGEAFTLFGPNGAGKTTLLRMIAGLIRPTAGALLIDGEDITGGAGEHVRQRIGYISHHSLTYAQLTALENLTFFARLYGVTDPEARARTLLDEVGLLSRADSLVGAFSRGMKQRLSIARALVHDPDIVLLDEPFTGLDQHAAGKLKNTLSRLRDEGRTVVMVTHNIGVGLHMSGRVAVQVAGKIVIDEKSDGQDATAFQERYFEAVGEAHY